jgi:outer membrane protein assembly factor BamE (lipoprotein component of BamABCDE complex)
MVFSADRHAGGMGTAVRLLSLCGQTMKTAFGIAVAVLAASCAAYDGYTLRPGASTEAEVRAVMGRPALEVPEGEGAKRLVYPRGPLGTQTFMAEIGKDGVLREVRPVLGEETFNRIQAGLTRDEILRMIGPPGDTMHFSLSDTTAWDYRFVDAWSYTAIFSVIFNRDGIVVSKFTRRIERDRGRD